MKENQMTNEDEKVAVENETPEATQETEAPVETPAEEPKAEEPPAEAPAEEPKAEETPAEETPAEEAPAEEPKTYGDRLRDAAVSELDQLIK